MTWKEFKERVEELGVRDDDRISMIDVGSGWPFVIERDEHGCVDIFYAPDKSDLPPFQANEYRRGR